jgi:hypothetical protein
MEFDIRLGKMLGVSAGSIKDVRTSKTYKSWHTNNYVSPKKRAVVQLSMQNEFIARYDSAADAARILNKNRKGIARACSGKRKASGGFIWLHETKYKDLV